MNPAPGMCRVKFDKMLTCSKSIAFSTSTFETQGNSCLVLSGGSCVNRRSKTRVITAFYEKTLESLDSCVEKRLEMSLQRRW